MKCESHCCIHLQTYRKYLSKVPKNLPTEFHIDDMQLEWIRKFATTAAAADCNKLAFCLNWSNLRYTGAEKFLGIKMKIIQTTTGTTMTAPDRVQMLHAMWVTPGLCFFISRYDGPLPWVGWTQLPPVALGSVKMSNDHLCNCIQARSSTDAIRHPADFVNDDRTVSTHQDKWWMAWISSPP